MEKTKFPLPAAESVAAEIMAFLGSFCERWIIAGSIRRRKEMVSDIEVVFIPESDLVESPDDMFAMKEANYMDAAIAILIEEGILAKRRKSNGQFTYGPNIKLMVHVHSGIPVDFFACSGEGWWTTLVSRTGGKDSNMELAIRREGMLSGPP